MTDQDKVLLGTANLPEAQALRAQLGAAGFELALVHNEATCGKGCAVKVEVWAHVADAPAIARHLGEQRAKVFASMGYDGRLADEVFDASRAEAVCPACGTSFATTATKCPECDLCFDVPESSGCK